MEQNQFTFSHFSSESEHVHNGLTHTPLSHLGVYAIGCQKRTREADKREDRIPQWLVTYLTRRFVALDVVEDVDVKPRRASPYLS